MKLLTEGARAPSEELPKFFTDRALGWGLLALGILAGTVFFALATDHLPLIWVGVALDAFCLGYAAKLLHIGKTKNYFVLRMTCIGSRPLSFAEGLPAYIDPTSNTAFKSSKMVALQTESGQTIYFTYERSRKFIAGMKYDFYFKKPPEGQVRITNRPTTICASGLRPRGMARKIWDGSLTRWPENMPFEPMSPVIRRKKSHEKNQGFLLQIAQVHQTPHLSERIVGERRKRKCRQRC